jgi:hypothetical protein
MHGSAQPAHSRAASFFPHEEPMSHRHSFPDGTRLIGDVCITPMQHIDTFTIQVNSLDGVSEETIVNILQTKLKVEKIEHTERNTIIRDYRPAPSVV